MKKVLLFLVALLTGVSGAMAETYTITFDKSTGSFYNGSNAVVTTGWIAKWVSNEAGKPAVTLTASANNINADNGRMAPGQSTSSTYSLSVEDGYKITGFELNCPTFGAEVTVTPNGEAAVVAATGENIVVTSSATSFVYSGSNSGRIQAASSDGGSFKIFVEDIPAEKVAAYNTAKGWINSIQSANGLVKDASKYISNAKSSAEGTYEALLDGVYTTYFHSAYGNEGPDADHYLQAELTEAVDAIHFYYKKRSQNNANRPTSITISGSNDGTSFTDITTINSGLPTDASVIDYASDKVSLGASYKYLRFTVTATNNGAASNGHVFFTFSEFYIMPANDDIDAAITMYKSLPANAGELTDAQVTEINTINTALTSSTVNVTYELYESDGTTLLSSETVVQNKNSEVAIPSSFTSYYYTNSSEGTIGTSDCTIKVTRTVKDGIVYPISNLSNNKSYYIYTREQKRGGLSTFTDGSTTYLAAPTMSQTSMPKTAKKFAILSYEDKYYLYSVEDSKFVTYSTELLAPLAETVTGTSDAITFAGTSTPLFMLRFDGSNSKIINASTRKYGLVFNGWGANTNEWDDGCQYSIEEADDFDPTAALAALENYFHPTNTYDRVEAEILPYIFANTADIAVSDPAATIGKPFGISVATATQIVETYGSQLANKQFSLEEYQAAKAILEAGIVYPEAGKFYTIKNISNGKYINVKAANGIYADAATPVASSVVKCVVRNEHTYFATQGKEFGWCLGASYAALLDADGSGKYAHFVHAGVPGQVAFAHALGNGEGDYAGYLSTAFYTVNASNQVVGSTSNDAAAQWTIEEATEVVVPMNDGGDGNYYATLCAPFDATVSGAKAYTLAVSGEYLVPTEVATIAAGTPVLLKGTESSATLTIGSEYSATPVATTALTGSYLEKTTAAGELFLGKSTDGVGFYGWDGTTLAANRAYVAASAGVKGYAIQFDLTDAIQAVEAQTEKAAIYNMAGQRVQKAQKGLYIVNGKKVMVK